MSIVASIEDSTILRPPIDRAYAAGEAKGKGEGAGTVYTHIAEGTCNAEISLTTK